MIILDEIISAIYIFYSRNLLIPGWNQDYRADAAGHQAQPDQLLWIRPGERRGVLLRGQVRCGVQVILASHWSRHVT